MKATEISDPRCCKYSTIYLVCFHEVVSQTVLLWKVLKLLLILRAFELLEIGKAMGEFIETMCNVAITASHVSKSRLSLFKLQYLHNCSFLIAFNYYFFDCVHIDLFSRLMSIFHVCSSCLTRESKMKFKKLEWKLPRKNFLSVFFITEWQLNLSINSRKRKLLLKPNKSLWWENNSMQTSNVITV